MEEVFNTTELLENILLEIDLRTLLTSAQRVNRQWNTLISNSPALQMALFFRPDPSTSRKSSSPERGEQQAVRGEKRRNPLLAASYPGFRSLFSPEPSTGEVYRSFYEPPPPFFADNASWKRMFPQHPAGRVIGVMIQFFAIVGPVGERTFQVLGDGVLRYEYRDAIRMGQLVGWVRPSPPFVERPHRVLCVSSANCDARLPIRRCWNQLYSFTRDENEVGVSEADELLVTADVVLSRYIDVARFHRPGLNARDLLRRGPNWNPDVEEPDEILRVTEFYDAGVESWLARNGNKTV